MTTFSSFATYPFDIHFHPSYGRTQNQTHGEHGNYDMNTLFAVIYFSSLNLLLIFLVCNPKYLIKKIMFF